MPYFDNQHRILEKKTTVNSQDQISSSTTKNNFQTTSKKTNKSISTLLLSIFGGFCGILLSSFIWIESFSILKKYYQYDHKYAYMALIVSVCVGMLMRWAGARSHKLALVAVLMTLLGSLVGTLLSILVHFAEALDVSYADVFDAFDFNFLFFLLQDRFEYLDIVFYLTATILAYFFVKRR